MDRSLRLSVAAATATATVMIAFQMGAKATRDALFLSSFDVAALPVMVMASAAASLAVAFAASRIMASVGPAKVIAPLFAISAGLLLVEWWLLPAFRRGVAVGAYFHFSGLGAVLISGFWSIVNERFDPRTAKRYIGRIAGGGTVGGFLGGLLAERVAALFSLGAMLPTLALLHVVCAGTVMWIGGGEARRPGPAVSGSASGLRTLTRSPYLRGLILLVILTTVAEGLLDYVFKARASEAFSDEQLLRVFAAFYMAVGLVTLGLQTAGSKVVLERLGIGRTVALLPVVAAGGSAAALAFPPFVMMAIARGAESVTRNGLYRASYELLFAPVAPQEKRAAKPLLDVGVVRGGDIIGAAIVQVALIAVAVNVVPAALLGLAVVVSAGAIVVALRLQRGYADALGNSLLARAGDFDMDEARAAATRSAFLQTAIGLGDNTLDSMDRTVPDVTGPPPVRVSDALRAVTGGLASPDPAVIRQVLDTRPFPPAQIPDAVALLAWDAVATDVIAALRTVVDEAGPFLLKRLADPDEAFAIRRRVPLILASCKAQSAVDGLLAALRDPRFEVRYRSGRALTRLLSASPDLSVNRQLVIGAVLREARVERGVWEGHRLLDRMDDESWSPVMDEALRNRANRSLEHVFTMLALVMPGQPLKLAFAGLHTGDAHLRGTALEYLETTLPDDIRVAIWPFLDDTRGPRRRDPRPTDQVLSDLLASNASVMLNLEALRRKSNAGSG